MAASVLEKLENGWNFTNTPIYQEVGNDLQLIGITHKDFPRQQPINKMMRFRKVVGSLDHVAFEANEEVHAARTSKGYEDLAVKIARGKRYFLDKDTNYPASFAEQGMSPFSYTFFQAIRFLSDALSRGVTNLGPQDIVWYLTRSEQGNIDHAIAEAVAERLPLLCSGSFSLPGQEGALATTDETISFYTSYRHLLRDAKIYAPKLREIQQLSGRKGAILGASHIPRLHDILASQGPELPSWQEYVASAPAPIQESLVRMEAYIARNFTEGSR